MAPTAAACDPARCGGPGLPGQCGGGAAGLIGRRVDLSFAVLYFNGDTFASGGGYDSVAGTAQVRWAMSRQTALTGSYIFYRYVFPRTRCRPRGSTRASLARPFALAWNSGCRFTGRRLLESPDRPEPIVNALTVDVEDYFQVSAFESVVARGRWDASSSGWWRTPDGCSTCSPSSTSGHVLRARVDRGARAGAREADCGGRPRGGVTRLLAQACVHQSS